MLVAQTTRPVQKNRLRDELLGYVRTDRVDWGWEEGKRTERNKRRRHPAQTGAGQRREWQLNEQREEISIDVEEREEIFCSLFENDKIARAGIEPAAVAPVRSAAILFYSLLCPVPVRADCFFRLFLSLLSASSQPQSTVSIRSSPEARHETDFFEPAEWSVRLPGSYRPKFDHRYRSFSLYIFCLLWSMTNESSPLLSGKWKQCLRLRRTVFRIRLSPRMRYQLRAYWNKVFRSLRQFSCIFRPMHSSFKRLEMFFTIND